MGEFLVNEPSGPRDEDGYVIPLTNGTFLVVWSRQAPISGGESQVRSQLFAADGTRIGAELQIDSLGQLNPVPGGGIQLGNGNILVLFDAADSGLPSGRAVWAQMLSPTGTAIGAEFQLNSAGGYIRDNSIVPMADGGFVAIVARPSLSCDPDSWDVFGQRFDASGAPVAAEFRVNSSVPYFQGGPDVAKLPDGGFVVVWETRDPAADTSMSAIMGQRYDANAQPVGGQFLVNTVTPGQQFDPNVVALAGGGFLVAWDSDFLGSTAIKAQIFDTSGNKVGTEFFLQQPGAFYYSTGTQIVATADGGFVVTWYGQENGSATQSDVYAASYNAAGELNGGGAVPYVRVNSQTAFGQFFPQVAQIANGNLVFTWASMAVDGGGLVAQIFSLPHLTTAAGSGDNGSISIVENSSAVTTATVSGTGGVAPVWSIGGGADAALFQINPSTGALSFIVAPDADNPADSNQDNVYDVTIAVRGDLFFDGQNLHVTVQNLPDGVTITGTNGNDDISGTSTPRNQPFATENEDTILGRNGNDVIQGLGGADIIDGGSGNDFLYGGSGNDELIGGIGDDQLYGDAGNDLMRGGAGADTYLVEESGDTVVELANEGIDLVQAAVSYTLPANVENLEIIGFMSNDGTGNELDNVITGYGGDNWLRGLGGNDTLRGGDGFDRLEGGDGNDTLIADSMDQLIDGGAGTDKLLVETSDTLNGELVSIEAIELVGGANLTLYSWQVSRGLAPNTLITGSGTITINTETGVFLAIPGFQGVSAAINFVINGTSGSDYIKASHFANFISTGVGADFIRGGNGVDTIDGGADNDKITGWGGADVLTGGNGNDQFRYLYAGDSGVGAAADRITDFTIGSDVIDLRLLDRDLVTPDIQSYALSFIGTAAFGSTGASQIRTTTSGADMLVQFDLDGNGTADMEIILQGLAGQTLSASDFLFAAAGAEPLPPAKSVAAAVMEAPSWADEPTQVIEPLLSDPANDAGLVRWLDPLHGQGWGFG